MQLLRITNGIAEETASIYRGREIFPTPATERGAAGAYWVSLVAVLITT